MEIENGTQQTLLVFKSLDCDCPCGKVDKLIHQAQDFTKWSEMANVLHETRFLNKTENIIKITNN